jgi:hypothetical protein
VERSAKCDHFLELRKMVITGVISKMGCSVFLVKGVGVKQGLCPNTVSIQYSGFYLKSSLLCRESPDMSLQFRNKKIKHIIIFNYCY